MSQSNAERKVKEALTESSQLAPKGHASVQNISGSKYISIPASLADYHNIDKSTSLERAYHPPTSTLIISLDGSPIFDED